MSIPYKFIGFGLTLLAPAQQAASTAAYAVTEIDRETIQSAASGRIDDVLRSVAGFQQFRRSDSRSSNPSAQGATLRALGGNASSRALVTLDGIPMADPFFGFIPFSALSPERLERVRVTRGGGSGPFGAGALSGTIELESASDVGLSGSALINDRSETELSASIAGRRAFASLRRSTIRSRYKHAGLSSMTTAHCALMVRIARMKGRMPAFGWSGEVIGNLTRWPMSNRATFPTW